MEKWLVGLILCLAFILRVISLSSYPVGFTPDEASFGYDAYSLLKTGKDQWGRSFPLVLESFGDFKSPLYAYLAVPSVAIFGLTKFAVRLPNAILGTVAVFVAYLLAKKLLGPKKLEIGNWKLEILAALLLAISPWHIMMSRGAFEANLVTLFIPLGIFLFLKEKYDWSAAVFGLSLFSYHSAKFIAPVIFIFLVIAYKVKRLVPLAIFSFFFLLMLYANSLGGGKRIAERSIFVGALEAGASRKIQLIQEGVNPLLARLISNKYQVAADRFIQNYTQYFSFRFLFIKGPAETTYGMIPGVGVLSLFEGIFLLGLVPVFMARKNLRSTILAVAGWILIAPITAALSTGVGYAANRALPMIPAWQILSAIGAYGLFGWFRKYDRKMLVGFTVGILLLAFWGITNVYQKYVVESPTVAAKGMLAGNLEKAQQLVATSQKYDSIVVPRSWSEPQIYIAFAAKYDPQKYQEATRNWNYQKKGVNWVDQMPEYSLGKFVFK